jgi:hypothetical protein
MSAEHRGVSHAQDARDHTSIASTQKIRRGVVCLSAALNAASCGGPCTASSESRSEPWFREKHRPIEVRRCKVFPKICGSDLWVLGMIQLPSRPSEIIPSNCFKLVDACGLKKAPCGLAAAWNSSLTGSISLARGPIVRSRRVTASMEASGTYARQGPPGWAPMTRCDLTLQHS